MNTEQWSKGSRFCGDSPAAPPRLQVSLGLDGFVHIIAAAFEFVAAGGVLDDFSLLHALHQAVVDTQGLRRCGHCKLGEDRLLLGGGRVLTDRPYTAIAVAYDIVVGKNLIVPGRIQSKSPLCGFLPSAPASELLVCVSAFFLLAAVSQTKEDAYP